LAELLLRWRHKGQVLQLALRPDNATLLQ